MKFTARMSSYIFHPLLILFYSLFLLLCLKPHLMGAYHWSEQSLLIILLFIYTFVVPAIGILLLKFTGLVKTLNMEDKYERYGPLIICAVFYLWLWVNLRSQDNIPKLMLAFILSSILCIFLAFIFNLLIKISLHTMSMASFACFWIIIRWFHTDDHVYYFRFIKSGISTFHIHHMIGLSLVIAGWIGTCRLSLKAHDTTEVYLGYIIGIISTILAFAYTF
jgi:hypothetical protein